MSPARRVVTFGEALLRLTPPGHRRLTQAQAFDAFVGGAELNTAIGVATLGHRAEWVSALPEGPLGDLVLRHARAHGVGIDAVLRAPAARLGLFFVEIGAEPRPSRTIYDRADSAFARMGPDAVAWPELLHGADALHVSGISPALGPAPAEAVERALQAAVAAGCQTTYDLNFRALLGSADDAARTVQRLGASIGTLIASAGEAEAVFGVRGSAEEAAERLRERTGIERVVVNDRIDHGHGRQARLAAAAGADGVRTSESPVFHTVDPHGGGDAFSAGLICGLLESGIDHGLALGAAMATIKQSTLGDGLTATRPEIEELLGGAGMSTRR